MLSGLRACTSNSRGALATCFEHEVRVEEDGVLLDLLPGLAEQVQRPVGHELHADLADQPPPAPVQGGHRVLGEDLVARHRVAEHHASGRLTRSARRSTTLWNRGSTMWNWVGEPDVSTSWATAAARWTGRRRCSRSSSSRPSRARSRSLVERARAGQVDDVAAAAGAASATGSCSATAAGASGPGRCSPLYAARHDAGVDLVELAQPALDRIGELTGETVNLAVPRGDGVVQVAQVDSRLPARRHQLGRRRACRRTAPRWARCSTPSARCRCRPATCRPARQHSIATRSALQRELDTVRRRGWAVAWEELEPGLVAIAAPVRARRWQRGRRDLGLRADSPDHPLPGHRDRRAARGRGRAACRPCSVTLRHTAGQEPRGRKEGVA